MRQVKRGGPPRRQSANAGHEGLALLGHSCGHLVAAPTDCRANESVDGTVSEGADALHRTSEDSSEEAAPARMHGRDDLTGSGRKDDGETVGCLNGKGRSPLTTASVDDDAIGIDGTPLPRRWMLERGLTIHVNELITTHPKKLDPGRVSLIHPDNVAAQPLRERLTPLADEGWIITHMQANIAA